MAENINDDAPMDEFADEELSGLFSAFDGMGASDELKAKALGAIAAAVGTSAAAGTAAAQVAAERSASSVAGTAGAAKASAGGKAAKAAKVARGPFRALRIASIAACVSVAVVGGVAYGMPTSHVVLSQGTAAVELNVNRFGVVVSAASDDDAGREIVDAGGLVNTPYEDAFLRVASAMGDASSITVQVESGDPAQRELLESGGASLFAGLADESEKAGEDERDESAHPDSQTDEQEPGSEQADEQEPGEEPSDVSPSGESVEPNMQEGGYQQYYSGARDSREDAKPSGAGRGETSRRQDAGQSSNWGSAMSGGEELGNPDSNPEAEGASEYVVSEEPVKEGELSRPQLPAGFGETLERSESLYDWSKWNPDSSGDNSWGHWKPGDSWDWGSWGSWGSGKTDDSDDAGCTEGSWSWGEWGSDGKPGSYGGSSSSSSSSSSKDSSDA